MALIKCTECGHEVSDKASACPNCGCPIGNVETAQEKFDEESEKTKTWLWVLIVALLCLIGGGYYAYTQFFNGGSIDMSVDEKKDSIDAKNAIVEITPEFSKALEVYDELAPFSEGYAAVRRGKKWGYINTKGEEVISCSYDYADVFSEGLAAVNKGEKWGYINTNDSIVIPFTFENKPNLFSEGLAGINKDGKWGWINKKGEVVIPISIEADGVGRFSEGLAFVCKEFGERFSFIDKHGKEIFGGKMNGNIYLVGYRGSIEPNDFPSFQNGYVYVPTEDNSNDETMFTKYDKQGRGNGNVAFEIIPEYSKFTSDDYSKCGIKRGNNVVVPAKYDMVDGEFGNLVHLSNGVFLVGLIEYGYGDEDNTIHYGYVNLNGNDTFSDKLKEQCRESKELANQQDEYEDEVIQEFQEHLRQEGADWLQGAWRLQLTDDYGNSMGYMYEVFNHGTSRSYISGSLVSERNYTISGNTVVYDKGHYQLDNNRQILIGADGQEFTKVSHDVNYTPNTSTSSNSSSSSYSNSSSSSGSSYRFSSAHDVIGYLSDKSFYNGDRCLRIRANGVWFNNYCATGAPYVQRFESYKALVRAVSTMGPTYGYIIDPINNTVTDDTGDVFRLR